MKITIKSTALSYIPLPRFLLDDGELSSDAKLLYALLLDRASISKLNGFADTDCAIRVYFTVEQTQKKLCRSKQCTTRIFKELEVCGLICRKKQGLGKPAVITLNYPEIVKLIDLHNDEVLSGVSTKRRENFNRMIDDAEEGKFDLIITKEISRFARNTLDSIQFTRRLLNAGVGVFFQNDNINTFDEDSELRLSIMSSIAKDELRKLSSRVKFGHQQAIKQSVVLGNNRIFGYKKDKGRLVIDDEQAQMVRELFEMYATGEYSMKQLEKIFWDKGYRNYNGNKIAHSTMSGMIANPKYKGYYVGNKVKVVDMFTKKQKFLPPDEWVMFRDESGEIVPTIVSDELWERANEVLRNRSEDVKNRQGICNHANLLTWKLYCTHCVTPYYRRDSVDKKGNKNSKWVCSGKIKGGRESCPSFAIYEEEIKPLIFEVFKDTKDVFKGDDRRVREDVFRHDVRPKNRRENRGRKKKEKQAFGACRARQHNRRGFQGAFRAVQRRAGCIRPRA